MQFIGIDVGRHMVKAVTMGKTVELRSRVGEWRERRLTSGGDYEVEVDGRKWFVADLAEESYFAREMASESKVHEETRILFLTGLALVAQPEEELLVTTGLPVAQHTDPVKEALTNLLRGRSTVCINGVEVALSIERIGIVPEAGGAYWDAILDDRGGVRNGWLAAQRVRVVDIGSRTVNFCTVERRRYLDRDSGTLSYGLLELTNSGNRINDEAKGQFARRVAADLFAWLGYRQDEDVVLVAGGGAIMLRHWFKDLFPLAHFAENPCQANARGYYKMGLVVSLVSGRVPA